MIAKDATTFVPATAAGGVARFARNVWCTIRTLAGDDAYEKYCAHHRVHHPDDPPLSRREFYVRNQQEKWNGIKRCC